MRRRIDTETLLIAEVADSFDAVLADLAADIDNRREWMINLAARTEAIETIQAVDVALAASDLQRASSEAPVLWVQLRLGPDIWPLQASDVQRFSGILSRIDTSLVDVRRASAGGPSEDLVVETLRSPEVVDILERYHRVVEQRLADPLPEFVASDAPLDISGLEPVELLEIRLEVAAFIDQSSLVDSDIQEIVDLAIEDVVAAAREAESDARGARLMTIGLVAFSLVVLAGGALALSVFVVRPVSQMAAVADALGKGDLSKRITESGPVEFRTAGIAVNQAISSLQVAEAQAMALADERLHAPVLGTNAPGRLGQSLQVAFERLAASMTERDAFQRELAHEASHDDLTGLRNRSAVLEHLEMALWRAKRAGSSLAVLYLDLDDFKDINDSNGHLAGDVVLRAVADSLNAATRKSDVVGRLGGDEFIVIVDPIDGPAHAARLAERIRQQINTPLSIGDPDDGLILVPSASVGVAVSDGDELAAEELLRDADLALYRAKALGRGRVDVCDDDLRGEMLERGKLEQAISVGLDNGEFTLHFQPVFRAVTRSIVAVEALIRWNRPGYGLVGPCEVIPVAERTDLIVKLDKWVLTAAMEQLHAWSDHPQLRQVPIGVNVSARHLTQQEFAANVEQALERFKIDPGRLVLEITETALVDDLEAAAREDRPHLHLPP